MKTTRNLPRALAAALAVLIAGCATPESRIRESPQAFARLDAGQQALVRTGQIARGFDRDAVRLALGEPDRIVVETKASGQREIWHYLDYGSGPGSVVFDGFYSLYANEGGPFPPTGSPAFEGYPGYYPPFRPYGAFADPYFSSGSFFYGSNPPRAHDRMRVLFDTTGHVSEVRQAKP